MITKSFGSGKCLNTGNKPNDDVQTPREIARKIIDMFEITGKVLEPFRGGGSFYDQLSGNKDWCEIKDGRDFFDYHERVDWIITNPPYSVFDEVLNHSFEIADNIVFLVPLSKIVSSFRRIRGISEYGGVPYMYILSASKCGFPFGFPACAIYMKRDYKGETKIVVDRKED